MPHDVIMPALGVAQDTGLIISWLKKSGDAIKIGDALMEIETDKAVMEVEAQANGYLTNVSAAAGDHVPVGQVIGVIAESFGGVDSATPVEDESNTPTAADIGFASEDIPEGKKIIMPALGMAQDTGLIVAWHKQPGDPVNVTDILLEVETDKSVMEVETGHDGYVAAILASAQQSVPVGSIIAVITASKPETIQRRSNKASAKNADPDPAVSNSVVQANVIRKVDDANNQSPMAAQSMIELKNRILASPKARRLAMEQGLDFERLVIHGIAQPYHVADLEKLKSLGSIMPLDATSSQLPVHAETVQTVLRVDARVAAQGHIEFVEWMAQYKHICLPARMAWLRYASAALRLASGRALESMVVEVRQAHETQGCYQDADHSRMSSPITESVDQQPDLILRDLTDSPITFVTTAAPVAPLLSIRQEGSDYVMALDYRAEQLDENVAINFMTDLAARMSQPLHHLL